ncbi:MAG TPA: response regulator [Opitutaceae bacterium]
MAEDEAMIRELIATFLSNKGYTVHESENGRQSLEQAMAIGADQISLLITDLVMPVMGGLELASKLRKIQPELRVLYISGYTDDLVVLEGESRTKTAFLRKPFSFETLGQRVESLLAQE